MVGQEDKRTNNRTMLPALKISAAAGYQGPVKIELLKGAGPLNRLRMPGALIRETVQSQDKSVLSIVSKQYSLVNPAPRGFTKIGILPLGLEFTNKLSNFAI